jgi:hypothetical protein
MVYEQKCRYRDHPDRAFDQAIKEGRTLTEEEHELYGKLYAKLRKRVPRIRISLPIDMAELIAIDLERKSEWVGVSDMDPDWWDCYQEYIKQVKLQLKKRNERLSKKEEN